MGEYYTPPKMVPMRLVDCLFDVETNPDAYAFYGYYPNPEGGEPLEYPVFSGNYFVSNLFTLYYNRLIMVDEDRPEASAYEAFDNWRDSRKNYYGKMYHALEMEYNPIENYEMTEIMTNDVTTHDKGAQVTRTHNNTDTNTKTYPTKETTELTPFTKETNELTPFTKETNELTPFQKETHDTTNTSPAPNGTAATNTHSQKAFNNNNFVETQKDVRTGSEQDKTEITFTGTQKNEKYFTGTQKNEKYFTGTQKTEKYFTGNEVDALSHTGTITDVNSGTDTDTRNYTLTRTGNIGTQTAADMLLKEYDNLKMNLAERAISEFFNRFTFYAEGVI